MLQEQVQQAVISNYRHCTVPMAGTLIGTLKAKVPSRDMGLTTDIHPCAQIVSEWLSACLTLHICSRNVQAPVK